WRKYCRTLQNRRTRGPRAADPPPHRWTPVPHPLARRTAVEQGCVMSHGQDQDSGADIGFATARGRDWPSVRQFNVFVANRVGGLLRVVRCFEASDNRIVSLTVVDTADCAIIRLVVRDPERAAETLAQARLPYTESDLLVVQLPDGKQPLLEIFK